MKDNKHIQSFNEHQENLNISDVSDIKLYSEKDIKTAVATGIVVWQERKEQTIGGLYADIMKILKEHTD
jgi:hypothetical protein